jgi:hypothetical protein
MPRSRIAPPLFAAWFAGSAAVLLLLLAVFPDTAHADETGWTSCANEQGQCAFSGTRYVRYGQNGTHLTRLKTGGSACTNEAFEYDPVPGVGKACWFADATPTWVQCANEGGRCTFSGLRDVRYGQNGSFTYKTSTRSIDCTNESIGADPLQGVGKRCWYAFTPPTYQACANESGRCNFEGSRQVRYGANGKFAYKTVTGGLDCNNTAVGTDPIPGVGKRCWVGDDEAKAPAPAAYLSASGTRLMLDGAVYKTVGFNAPGMTGCLDGTADSDATLNSYFASLRPRSLTRTWAFSTRGTADLDRVVMAAERHNQMLILSLADGAGFCEDDGRSGGPGTLKTPEWYGGGYRENYIPWLRSVAERYKRSKAIGMWELMNEPHAPGVTNETMRAFFDEAAEHLKLIDPNHLIESGAMAQYAEGTTDYALVHGGPDIDVASVHEYDYDYKPCQGDQCSDECTEPGCSIGPKARESVSHQVTAVLPAMASINKPLLVGESGIQVTHESECPEQTSVQMRTDAFRQKYAGYLAQEGIPAVLVWAWSARGSRSGCDQFDVLSEDPLVPATKNFVIQ